MIHATRDDWSYAETMIDPEKVFILWSVKVQFCTRQTDFAKHFGRELDLPRLTAELKQDGFLREIAHEEFVLTDFGAELVSRLSDTNRSSFAEKLAVAASVVAASVAAAPSRTPSGQTETQRSSSSPMIEAIGLSKFYGIFTATKDISFKVHEGELVAFLGPNGAGKSTTMKMLTGYLAPSEGMARIAGHDMAKDRLDASARLGYLPESGPLYPDMTPHSLLSFFADARGMNTARKKDRIDAVIEMCRLGSVVYKPISELSKGYRQRVGMAQALLHEPDVLIMDEPTAGLDPNQIRDMREVLRQLSETKTILLSTHILQEVEAMASRVIMINEGRLVYDGAVADLTNERGGHEKLIDIWHNKQSAGASA